MNALVSTTLWVVGKALAPVVNGVLAHWDASKNLGLNVEAVGMELLLVQATLETASRKHISGKATEELLRKLQDSARCAEDLLDELDYFRIHDQLHGTYDAADHHAKGGVHDLVLNARHTASDALGFSSAATPAESQRVAEDERQRIGCCVWSRARWWSRGNSSSTPNANKPDQEEVSRCMPQLGKLLPRSSSPNVQDDNSGSQSTHCGALQREHPEKPTMLGFNRVVFSERMKHIVEQLQPLRRDFTTIMQFCDPITVPDIAQSRPITTGQSIEPKLYGRDDIVNSIIHDMTKGKYHNSDLNVLPIVGPAGIGKTTMIQHIYHNEEAQKHFHVVIWVCVSFKFNLNKLLEDIKEEIPLVEGEKGYRPEDLIEQRLKSKRFLLVLDDIWECGNEDDWERLLLPLKTSQEKGSMVLVTTRFPAVAAMVGTTSHSIELEGLEAEYFRELFHAFVFGDDRCRRDHFFLLETGDEIMEKLKGSPLAARTVGRLLRRDLSLRHWRRVLESKEWEMQTGVNDIMPALKLSYDNLPFHQQQCFSSSALFPEDHIYRTTELINLWIGLDILQPDGRNQTLEDIGLSYLNDLVTHGFFREEGTRAGLGYVMHDLLHDLALKVASHDYVSLHRSNVGSVRIQPSIRHLSIIIDDDDYDYDDDTMSVEIFKSQLRNLKTILKVKQLHTLMIFGEMSPSFAKIFGDLVREANALRVLRLVHISSSVESILHTFSALVHLRYLCLGTMYGSQVHLPLTISRFYHLRILDLGSWYGCRDLPKELSNLAKLCRFYTQSDSNIHNVGKLKLLEELTVFRVNKESEGFEPKQLENLTELRELGIYNLENIHTKEDAAKAKLIEKNYLERLTLDWDSERSNIEPDVEAVIIESLQPPRYLEGLRIGGHGGPSCPTWLGDNLTLEALKSLHLIGVSWKCLPSLGKIWGLETLILKHIAAMKEFAIEQRFCRLIKLKLVGLGSFEKWGPSQDTGMFPLLQVLIIRDCPRISGLPFSNPNQDWKVDWFPKLQELEIVSCPGFLLVPRIPWTETLRHVNIIDVKLLEKFEYNSKSLDLYIKGKDALQRLDQVLAFSNLAGLEQLTLEKCPPMECKHFLMLTSLKKLAVDGSDGLVGSLGGGDDVQWQHPVEHLVVYGLGGASVKKLTELLSHLPGLSELCITKCQNVTQLAVGMDMQQTTSTAAPEVEKEEEGLLLFPADHSGSLRVLYISECPELFLSPSCIFPSSLLDLNLKGVEGLGTLEPLSNLTSLTRLALLYCGEDLRCKGLGPLLAGRGQLKELVVYGSCRFFAGWDLNLRQVLLQQDEGEDQQLVSPPEACSSKLQVLRSDDTMGLLATPICSFLSSSLTKLKLRSIDKIKMERFSKEQEDALHLLTSLQQLKFSNFRELQHLPTGLHKLTNLQRLEVDYCPAVRSLPKDGLPKSLQELYAHNCFNEELKQQCRGFHPKDQN